MKENIIEIKNLKKSFGQVQAVKDLSFQVKRGELFAFLGVNGAGKSTTISMICGQLKPDGGVISIDGLQLKNDNKQETKNKIGVVFQDSVLDKALTGKENLKSRAALYGITGAAFKERYQELESIFCFGDFINRPLGKLSGGQRRRIDIARALIHKPEILILDEPTTGLDPQTRQMIWGIIERLQKQENMTVFLTTHYMEEAARADYVVIIDSGSMVAHGTPYELKTTYVSDTVSLYGITKEEAGKLGRDYVEIPGGYSFAVKETKEATELILKYPEIFRDYEIVKGGMDDVFLTVTGKSLKGGVAA